MIFEDETGPDFTAAALLLVAASLAYQSGFPSDSIEIVKVENVEPGDVVFSVADQDFRVDAREVCRDGLAFIDQYGQRRRFLASSSVVRVAAPKS